MDPIDYSSVFNNVPTFGDSLVGGIKTGAAISQIQAERQQKELAAQQAAQQHSDLLELSQNPTPSAIGALMIKYPALSEQLKRGSDVLTTDQQRNRVDNASQVYAAVQSGAPEVAISLLKDQATAARNSGQEQNAKAAETFIQLITDHPEQAKMFMGTSLAAAMGPDKFTEAFGKLGSEQRAGEVQAGAVRSANAKASGEETDATQKVTAAIGSAAGSLVGKKASPVQVSTMFKSLVKKGLMSNDEANLNIATVLNDPNGVDHGLGSFQMAGLKPEEQVKLTTPDANAKLSADTSRYSADSSARSSRYSADTSARTAANRLAFDQEQAEPAAPPASSAATNGKSGTEFLSALDKPVADQVKALAEGRMAFPVGKAAQSDYWQQMISKVAQYDPSFDAVNYSARSKTRNDIVAGKGATNIKAINTAIAHMGQLNQQMTAMGNTRSKFYNKAANYLGTKVFGNEDLQTKVADVEATAEGVSGEMAKVFRDTGMSEHEIEAWRTKFESSTTPAAQKGTMRSAVHMLYGRMDAIQDAYKTGMGTTAAPLDILTPKSKEVVDKLLGVIHDTKPAGKAAPKDAPAAPALPGGWTVKEH